MDKRTVGILANVKCHKTWHVTYTKLLALKSVDHMEEILWRVGLRSAQFDKETATICSHHLHVFEKYCTKYVISGLPAKNGEKARKSGWSESGNRKTMSGAWEQSRRRQGVVLKFFVFFTKVIFSAFNCMICCDNVLCTMYYTNTKCSDMWRTQDLARRGATIGGLGVKLRGKANEWGRIVEGPTNAAGG